MSQDLTEFLKTMAIGGALTALLVLFAWLLGPIGVLFTLLAFVALVGCYALGMIVRGIMDMTQE